MSFTDSPWLSVIIIVAVIVLLLLVLWLINESRKKKYYEDAIRYILSPGLAPVRLNWEAVSPPAPDGVMTSRATAPLEGLSDEVQLALKGKDLSRMREFMDNVKFRFGPIYTPPPPDIFQSLLRALRGSPDRKRTAEESAAPGEIPLDEQDVLVEFGMPRRRGMEPKPGEKGSTNAQVEKTYYAVAFNIDPTIWREHDLGSCPTPIACACNRRNYYSTYERDITETVSASQGSVDAVLGAASSVVYTGQQYTISLSNPGGYYRYSSVGGRNRGSNTYRLTGTWTAW